MIFVRDALRLSQVSMNGEFVLVGILHYECQNEYI